MASQDPNAPPNELVAAPHAPLTRYYASEEERSRYLRAAFDATAVDYDRIESVLAFGSGPWYRRQALRRAGLGPGQRVLDVGFGTGLVAREALALIGPTGSLVGVDPSPGMLAASGLRDVDLREGRAESLPVGDADVDFVSMGYALRHVGDLRAAFAEFHRVLRPGGRVLVLEITRPARPWASALLKGYMRGVVPLIARVVSRGRQTPELWRYYWDTIEACVPPERVCATLAGVGFASVTHQRDLGIFSEFVGVKPGR